MRVRTPSIAGPRPTGKHRWMRARALPSVFLLVFLAAPGCALAHERSLGDAAVGRDVGPVGRDASAPDASGGGCLPSGLYDVTVTYLGEMPPGCLGGPGSSTFALHVPPIQTDFSGMCGEGSVTITPIATDPCAWSIQTSCPIPDASSRTTGTLSAHTSGVEGRFAAEVDTFGGTCAVTLVLTGAP